MWPRVVVSGGVAFRMKTEQLVGAFVELADTLVDDFDVVELLQLLANRCVELLGAAAAGLLLADGTGSLQVAVTSSERARLLELYQLQSAEGPCLDCFRGGSQVSVTDMDGASKRWPRFAPAARGPRGGLQQRARGTDAGARRGHRRVEPVRRR
jgi:hypothetical protein